MASAAPSPAASTAPSTTPTGINSELWNRAESLYQPSYNATVNQINTEAQKNQTELERLIALANDTYANYKNEIDTQLATAIKKSDQSISDEMVKRGLSRSTYALDRQAQATADLNQSALNSLSQALRTRDTNIAGYNAQKADVIAKAQSALATAEADYNQSLLSNYYTLADAKTRIRACT